MDEVAVRKILLTMAKSGSDNIDPEPARKASALRIVAALPGLKEPKLKGDLTLIRNKFDAADVNKAADEAEKGLGG
ncbi:MAG: hypothetical protein K8T20_00975 [Planctomycetes bacterium]|nr:hypothetical protein [Planctomycetota bacterium]